MEEYTKMTTRENPFELFFNEKIHIGSLAEKAVKNFKSHDVESSDKISCLYYYSIGHALKNIDYNVAFKCEINDAKQLRVPTRFLNLLYSSFNKERIEIMYQLINNIRDICSHYLHRFDYISLINNFSIEKSKENLERKILPPLEKTFVPFLNEAFELAVRQICIKGGKDLSDEDITAFLCDKFPIGKNSKISKDEAIQKVLYTNIDEELPMQVGDLHTLFTIHKGKYLSLNACLFFLSMFLYKHEAEKLISRIKGFKRSSDNFREKRDLFTFYSKKISSRDTDNEEKLLVKFRDIIQYLNHYPTTWNNMLLTQPDNIHVNELKNGIVEMEIKRLFPNKYEDNDKTTRFITFAKCQLFS